MGLVGRICSRQLADFMDDPADFSFQRINIVVTATINPLAKTIMATVDRLLNNRIDKVFTRNWVVDGFAGLLMGLRVRTSFTA